LVWFSSKSSGSNSDNSLNYLRLASSSLSSPVKCLSSNSIAEGSPSLIFSSAYALGSKSPSSSSRPSNAFSASNSSESVSSCSACIFDYI